MNAHKYADYEVFSDDDHHVFYCLGKWSTAGTLTSPKRSAIERKDSLSSSSDYPTTIPQFHRKGSVARDSLQPSQDSLSMTSKFQLMASLTVIPKMISKPFQDGTFNDFQRKDSLLASKINPLAASLKRIHSIRQKINRDCQ